MTAALRLELIDVSKRFGDMLANDAVSLQVEPGEIHALLGENGAGKSTLMKVLYGVHSPDSGSILWNNREVDIADPNAARQLGIGMVFQHFCLIDRLSVRENLQLALPELELASIERRFSELRDRLQLAVDLDASVSTLSAGERQRVEILRCLMADVQLLILDEPTSVLTPLEVGTLIKTLKLLAAEGCSILFISHKLAEVEQLCDRATILRAGQVTGSVVIAETDRAQLVAMMMGQTPPEKPAPTLSVVGDTVLDARFERCGRLQAAELKLAAGQIAGIGGVAGSGQEALVDLISGEQSVSCGELTYLGNDIRHASVAKRRQLGLRTLPVDRLGRAAAAGLSLKENMLLTHSHHAPLQQGAWVDWQRLGRATAAAVTEFDIKTPSESAPARDLSGGNLQRFLVARELLGKPRLLVCYNPTWGVDPAAAARIHQALLSARDAGAAVLLLSEDIDELFQLCDLLGALCNGHLSPLLNKADATPELMGRWITEQADAC
ncbi:MAG: ABC transporter ATP-binding protein [Pseudomonadota bacterium]